MNSLATNTHVEGGPYPEKMLQQLVWFAEAIERAVKGGWNQQLLEDDWHVHAGSFGGAQFCYPHATEGRVTHIELFSIIYDTEFAKALWGDLAVYYGTERVAESAWQFHLQRTVIAKDPLAYIEEHQR